MKRPALIWMTFLLFLALGLGAMGWMTRQVLLLEQSQARATAAAQLEENVRLALWRMDYAIAPLISQENSRPYFEYQPVFPAERAYTRMYTELKNGDVLVPSPLLTRAYDARILLHFQVGPDGKLTSPQAPDEKVRQIATDRYVSALEMEQATSRLANLQKLVSSNSALFAGAQLARLRDVDFWANNKLRVNTNGSLANYNPSNRFNEYANVNSPPQQSFNFEQQQALQQKRGQQEFQARAMSQSDNNDVQIGNNSVQFNLTPGVSFSVMKPLWAGDTLLLARQVSVNGQRYVQGCVLDWPLIRKSLVESTVDLLGETDVVPVHSATDDKQPRMLASIPARLIVPENAAPATASFFSALAAGSPTHVTLTIAWAGALLAAGAVAVLLSGVMTLSERRGAFVSAVTHELRTPLTTLRMYTEMLADGMISDPAQQESYHKTLRSEANRLGHLVDNVLLYSRLERSNRDARLETAPLGDVLDRVMPRLTDRASQAAMQVSLHWNDEDRATLIRANLLSVEQILFNLIDNACKYAATADDRMIHLSVQRKGRFVQIQVRDHGPGLDASARARLFQPFSKSVTEAANSAPGLGLGLALSHRLARNMGATLRLEEGQGAAFVLELPVDHASV